MELFKALVEGEVVGQGSYEYCFSLIATYVAGIGWTIQGDRGIVPA